MARIGVFGATFDPPHRGHADAVGQALLDCDQVWVVPSLRHAFGKRPAPYRQRLALLQGWHQELCPQPERVRIMDLEAALDRGDEPVYSIDLLDHLAAMWPRHEFVLVIGEDNAQPRTWTRFHLHEAIERDYGRLIVRARVPLRSTAVRSCLASAAPDPMLWLTPMVGERSAALIMSEGLYRPVPGGCHDAR